MKRPDQDDLEMYARDYKAIDSKLQSFSVKNKLELEINAFRQPCRVLRRRGNPEMLIDISLSDYWREVPLNENMMHSMTLVAYYDPHNSLFIWKYANELLGKIPFSVLREKLDSCLEKAAEEINHLTPESIMKQGKQIENLKKKYNV